MLLCILSIFHIAAGALSFLGFFPLNLTLDKTGHCTHAEMLIKGQLYFLQLCLRPKKPVTCKAFELHEHDA